MCVGMSYTWASSIGGARRPRTCPQVFRRDTLFRARVLLGHTSVSV